MFYVEKDRKGLKNGKTHTKGNKTHNCSFHLLFLIHSIYKAKIIIGFYNETSGLIFTWQKSPMHHAQGKFIMKTWSNVSVQMLQV